MNLASPQTSEFVASQIDTTVKGRLVGASSFEWFDPEDYAETYLGELSYGNLFAYLFRRFGYPRLGWDHHKELVQYVLTTPMEDVFLSIRPGHNSFGYITSPEISKAAREEDTAPHQQRWQRFQQWALEQHGFYPFYLYEVWGRSCTTEEMGSINAWIEEFHPKITTVEQLQPFRQELVAWLSGQTDHFLELYAKIEPQLPRKTPLVEGDVRSQIKAALIATIHDLKRPVNIRDWSIDVYGYHSNVPEGLEAAATAGYGIEVDYFERFEKFAKQLEQTEERRWAADPLGISYWLKLRFYNLLTECIDRLTKVQKGISQSDF